MVNTMTVDEALERIYTRPAERCWMDGYFDEWDEETCAYVLAEDIDRLRKAIKQHKSNLWGDEGPVDNKEDEELYASTIDGY